MIICKDGCYAYTGKTAADAFEQYLDSGDDRNRLNPQELEWFSASEMVLEMKLSPKPKAPQKKKVSV